MRLAMSCRLYKSYDSIEGNKHFDPNRIYPPLVRGNVRCQLWIAGWFHASSSCPTGGLLISPSLTIGRRGNGAILSDSYCVDAELAYECSDMLANGLVVRFASPTPLGPASGLELRTNGDRSDFAESDDLDESTDGGFEICAKGDDTTIMTDEPDRVRWPVLRGGVKGKAISEPDESPSSSSVYKK